jgi:hypothetical protein
VTFQVRFPDDVIFNKELRLDLMTIYGRPVLHIIDTGTKFSAARFLAGQDDMAKTPYRNRKTEKRYGKHFYMHGSQYILATHPVC